MEPFVPIPGKPPRKVVIDRQRKLFASLNIEELLMELEGINYKEPQKRQEDWLPLEPFDDNEYDCRTPHEWIQLGYNEDGKFEPVAGKGLWRDEEGRGHWRKVLVYKYDEERELFEGVWDGTPEKCELTRINLLFDAEDPRIFAQRVAKAHKERMYADSQIRYNYFIDNMPTQELLELDTEQVGRVLAMATASRFLKGKNIDTNPIMADVSLDYHRTMNKIIFDTFMEDSQGRELIPANLTLPPKKVEKEVPYFGMVPIPEHDFPEQFSNFCFNSLYIKDEVIKAMTEIKRECNVTMEDNRIFDTSIDKTIRLEEFKQLQNSMNSQIKFNLKDQWVSRLERIIRESFADVGKGWFNIYENSQDTYEFGKLKKFLTVVNFMMQDTVLTLSKNSVQEFVDFLLSFIPEETIVNSTADVKIRFKTVYDAITQEPKPEPKPLFVLDLIMKPGQLMPQYGTDPKDVLRTVLDIFDAGNKTLTEIPQLEPQLLKHLFKTHVKKMLKAPIRPDEKPIPPEKPNILPNENTWLWDAYELIRDNLEKAIAPLQDFLATFAAFESEHKLIPEKYVKTLNDEENPASVEEIKADI